METENTTDSSGDPDPIVASYKVYANPALSSNRKLLILQHPNKQGPVNYPYTQVNEVRIKNKSGMIEVDVPISHAHADYDRDKGQRWGGALAKSTAAKNGGTQGLAGGFGVGVSTLRPSKRRDEFERDIDMLDWSEAVRQDRVLRTQTLGGQLPPEHETECQYMVGVFKGNKLHLTPASALIQLRPQLHHIDAMAEQERASRREGSSSASKDGAPATASSAGARAIHMSIKSSDSGGGELTTETMADRLRTVQTEAWGRLQYEDEDSVRSWMVFSNNLVYRSAKDDSKDSKGEDGKGKGKGKEGSAIEVVDSSSDSEQLESQWQEEDLLKAISDMKDGPEGSQQQQAQQQQQVSRAGSSVEVKKEGASNKTPNAKGKSVTFKSTDSMDLD